jgi:LacI family transcriptional regulator
MPVTLADIARELGVSKMTVSRAINNHPLINHETRERVLEVARRMNYQPNQHARALVTNRSYLIGIIVPDLMNLYFAEVARAIESVSRPAGFQLLICSSNEDAATELAEVEALLHRTDGLIISSVLSPGETKLYRRIVKEGARIVLVDRTMGTLSCPAVSTDNVKVGRLATQHLIELGHKRVGHLRGDASSVSVERFEGYKKALADHKIRYDEALVRQCGFLESQGYQTMRRWIREGDLPDAVFVVNDPAAVGVMQALDEAGLRAGQDMSVVGAGNIHYAEMLKVPLTTVTWATSEMAQHAAHLLIELIEGKPQPSKAKHVIFEPELVVRASCGATQTARMRLRSAGVRRNSA